MFQESIKQVSKRVTVIFKNTTLFCRTLFSQYDKGILGQKIIELKLNILSIIQIYKSIYVAPRPIFLHNLLTHNKHSIELKRPFPRPKHFRPITARETQNAIFGHNKRRPENKTDVYGQRKKRPIHRNQCRHNGHKRCKSRIKEKTNR